MKFMNLKRFGASTLAAVMAMSMMGTAFAADATLQDDMTGQGNMEVVGTVKPITMIDVTLPVNGMQFTINADRTITWVDAQITSNSPAPLEITMIDAGVAVLEPDEEGTYNVGGAPELAADDAYADWDNLTRAETKAKIAISVNGNNISTADSASPVALGDVASAYGEDEFGAFQADPQTLDLEGSALYGKAWDNSEDMLYKYDTVIEFGMK